jgi:uncharacterized protein
MDFMKQKYKLSHYNVFHTINDSKYMWNTYSDALLELDKNAQEYIKSFSGIHDNSNEFIMLKDNGFIIYEEINEIGRVCVQEKQNMFNPNPTKVSFMIVLGMGCNYNCGYCFEKGSDSTENMTPEIALKVSEYICAEIKSKTSVKELHITWFGGEPLLYTDIIKIISQKLIEYSLQNNIKYLPNIVTNGRYLDSNVLTLLQELCIDSAQITLDGTCDVYCKSKGAKPEDFDHVINNIRRACEKMKIHIRLNIPNNDVNEAIKITDYILNDCGLLDKVYIYFAYLCDYSLTSDDSQKMFSAFLSDYFLFIEYIIRNYGLSRAKLYTSIPRRLNTACGIIRVSNACIGSQGELYKCHHDLGNSSRVIGDIWRGRFYEELELSYYAVADDSVRMNCLQCNYLPVCMSGCANNRISECLRSSCKDKKLLLFRQKLLEGGVFT